MNAWRAAPWRRLVPLGVLVLAVHLALLEAAPRRLAPVRPAPVQFATRSIAPKVARVAPPAPVPQPVAAPAPAHPTPAAEAAPTAPPPPAAVAQSPASPPPAAPAPTPPAPAAPSASPPAEAPGTDGSVAPAPQEIALPAPARVHFEVTAQKGLLSLTGKAVLDWRHDDRQYEARLEISGPTGTRVQRSTGRITEQGLAPDYFSDRSRGEQATHFDREHGQLVFSNNQPKAAIEDGMQDRVSVIVQLSGMIAGQPERFPPGTQLAVPTAGTRDADLWIFVVEGEEDLRLPGGTVRALKLQRLPRREYDQKVELWLAPRMDYAPVRLRLTNPNGDTVDNRWSSTDKG